MYLDKNEGKRTSSLKTEVIALAVPRKVRHCSCSLKLVSIILAVLKFETRALVDWSSTCF